MCRIPLPTIAAGVFALLVAALLPCGDGGFVRPAFAAEGKRVALCVGVENYAHDKLDPLKFAGDDATAVAERLRKNGFTVQVLVNDRDRDRPEGATAPTAENVRKALAAMVAGLSRDDIALVVLSGHGIQPTASPQPYFCVQDSNPSVDYDPQNSRSSLKFPKTLVGLGEIIEILEDSGAGRKLLLVDACRDAPQMKSMKGMKGGVDGSIAFQTPENCAVLLSCSRGEYSFELDKLQHGAFLHHVIEGLDGAAANAKGEVTWQRLVAHVAETVSTTVEAEYGQDGARQTPHPYGGVGGNVVLARVTSAPSNTPTKPAPAPSKPTPPPARPVETTAKPLVWPFDETAAKAGQMAWAKSLGKPVVEKNGIGMELVVIPPGTYTMGSPAGEKDRQNDETQVSVTLSKPFQMSRTEVTQGQWKAVMGTEPWQGQTYLKAGPEYAATYVSWADAVSFCEKLSDREGVRYRLPTEAEWEWACRAGTKTAYSFGSSEGELGQYAWFDGNAWDIDEKYAHRVGQKLPNGFGLSDMHGNVWEWCGDWYGEKLTGGRDPAGASSGSYRVRRGGSCFDAPASCRSALRFSSAPSYRDNILGFRLVLSPSGS